MPSAVPSSATPTISVPPWPFMNPGERFGDTPFDDRVPLAGPQVLPAGGLEFDYLAIPGVDNIGNPLANGGLVGLQFSKRAFRAI